MTLRAEMKEISDGKSLNGMCMQNLIYYMIDEKIDVVLVTVLTRISVFDDLLVEFLLLCQLKKLRKFKNNMKKILMIFEMINFIILQFGGVTYGVTWKEMGLPL